MFTMNSFFSEFRICRSFITECTDFFDTIRVFDISFSAKYLRFVLCETIHTRPKPPLPTTMWKLKLFLFTF